MSRRRTLPEEINNPKHYFNRYIAKETLHARVEQTEYEKRFVSLDAMGSRGDLPEREMHKHNQETYAAEDLDNNYIQNSFFAWIDEVDNVELYKAIQKLTEDQKIHLTL